MYVWLSLLASSKHELQLMRMEKMVHQFEKWYYSRPLFTRTYLTICIVFSLLISLNLISSYHIFYTFQETFLKLHVWRPLTAFLFIQKIDITFVISLYVLYFSLYRLEKSIVTGQKYAQFLWMICLLLGCCITIGSFINLYFFTDTFICALVYISTQKEPSQHMQIFSKFAIEIKYLPYVYSLAILVFRLEFSFKQVIIVTLGLMLGWLYLYLQRIGHMKTPTFLINYCERFVRTHRRPQVQ